MTIYLPTDVSGVAELHDRGLLKNLLDEAEARWIAAGARPAMVRERLQEPRKLLSDKALRPGRGKGLALFLGEAEYQHFQTHDAVPALVHVGPRYLLRPLIAQIDGGEHFWVLALSQEHVRLFSGTRDGVIQTPIPLLQGNLETTLNEQPVDRGAQMHLGGGTARSGVFHGQGGAPDHHKDELLRYFRNIDAAIKPVLKQHPGPLVLAAVESHAPLYRSANTFSQLLSQQVTGNADHWNTVELHSRAWALVEPHLHQARVEAVQDYHRLLGHGRAACDLRKVLSAAMEGRVETLLVTRDAQEWGAYHPNSQSLDLHESREAGDDDLVDLAAVETLRNGGKTYVVAPEQMPEQAEVAAVYRY